MTSLERIEASLLGTLLVVPPLIERTARLKESDLVTVPGMHLLDVLRVLHGKQRDPSMALVSYMLEGLYGPLELESWYSYLGRLMDHACPCDDTIDDYVDVLKKESLKRRLNHATR